MRKQAFSRGIFWVMPLALFSVAVSCSGGAPNQASLATGPGEKSTAGFALSVLDETYLDGGAAEGLNTVIDYAAEGVTVQILASGARNLKAIFFELAYDASSYNPAACEPTGLIGPPGKTLSITQFGVPGVVAHGQVLQHYESQPGFTGSGVVATIRFEAKPFAGAKLISTPPTSLASASQANWDPTTNSLSWDYCNQGDYDQNGEVNITDLTPIAIRFGEAGGFGRSEAASVVDGDGNGEINLGDITPIAVNHLNTVTEFGIFFTNQESTLPTNGISGDGLYPLTEIPLANAVGDPQTGRLGYNTQLLGFPSSGWIWVQPLHNGQKGTASNIFAVGNGVPSQDLPPVAAFQASAELGSAPLIIEFDASASSDPDGIITGYEWNWDGGTPGSEWTPTNPVPTIQHTFETVGTYTVLLRVTDNDGLSSVAQQVINVIDGPNQAPVASLVIAGEVFLEKHSLELDASGSIDPDGEIVSLDWDYDGDGEYDSLGETPAEGMVASHIYEIGEYNPTVRVWDDEGAAGVASQHISVIDDLPPVVVLNAAPLSGDAPFSTFLSAIGTYDPEGELDMIIWDLPNGMIRDGNVFDDYGRDSPIEFNTVEASFYVAGTFECTVRAFDSIFQSTTATVTVTVDSNLTVTQYTVQQYWDHGSDLSVANIAGVPCIAIDRFSGEAHQLDHSLLFYRASNPGGTNWDDPVVVKPEIGLMAWHVDLADIGGFPAISWSDKNPEQISYVRALDNAGSEWGQVEQVGTGISAMGGGNAIAEIDGLPAIAYTNGSKIIYSRASDVTGADWSEPVTVDQATVFSGTQLDLAEFNGLPSIVYSVMTEEGFTLRVANLLDTAGNSIQYSDLGGPDLGGNEPDFGSANGRPSVISDGNYFLADDSSGHTWSDPIYLGEAVFDSTALGSLNGWPAGFVGDQLVLAKDPLGMDWYQPWGLLHRQDDFDAVEMNNNLNVAYILYPGATGLELTYMVVSQ